MKLLKLSFNKTWEECLRMWKWIAKEIKKPEHRGVADLKEDWCKRNGYSSEQLVDSCFFCTWAETHLKKFHDNTELCTGCPGGKFDPDFNCMYTKYDYLNNPTGFYKKLKQLNRMRLKEQKEK